MNTHQESKAFGRKYAYARVSSVSQNLDRQILELQKYVAPENIVVDKESGRDLNRAGYQALKGALGLRSGDTLYIKSLDRLSRSKAVHRMKVILKNAELKDVKGGLHIFRKTFATRMYESGVRVEEIAVYIGDLESTTRKYYIAIRKKGVTDGEVRQVVKLPGNMKETIA